MFYKVFVSVKQVKVNFFNGGLPRSSFIEQISTLVGTDCVMIQRTGAFIYNACIPLINIVVYIGLFLSNLYSLKWASLYIWCLLL